MKKRLLALLLSAVLLLGCVPGVSALEPLCFVAMNDTVPLTLTGGEEPFYSDGRLFLPYTAFQINPNGVTLNYSEENRLLSMNGGGKSIQVDLGNKTYKDETGKRSSLEVIYYSGVLYIPAKLANHFGLAVTLLNSRSGYTIIRFTNGAQVYDDGMFVSQAESLVNHVAQEYGRKNQQDHGQEQHGSYGDDPDDPEEEREPATIYLAVAGEGVSQRTLDRLQEQELLAAFFLSETQIREDPELIRAIAAAGCPIGLTPELDGPVEASLRRANDALDRVLFQRSVFVLLPPGLDLETEEYILVREVPEQKSVEDLLAKPEKPHLYVARQNAPSVIGTLIAEEAALPLLLETTNLHF